jgi:hypothetical protein
MAVQVLVERVARAHVAAKAIDVVEDVVPSVDERALTDRVDERRRAALARSPIDSV